MPDLLKTLTIEADLHEVLLISLWYRKIAPQVNFNIAKKNTRGFTEVHI